jgi:hypothetical protein
VAAQKILGGAAGGINTPHENRGGAAAQPGFGGTGGVILHWRLPTPPGDFVQLFGSKFFLRISHNITFLRILIFVLYGFCSLPTFNLKA